MVSDYISARRVAALLALAVVALLLAQPWAARGSSKNASTGPRVAAPFAAIPTGAGSSTGAAGPTNLGNGMAVGHSVKNDTTAALRDIPPIRGTKKAPLVENENPGALLPHKDQPDTVVQKIMAPLAMPTPILNFNGIPFPVSVTQGVSEVPSQAKQDDLGFKVAVLEQGRLAHEQGSRP